MRCISIHLTDLCNSKCNFCVVGSPLYSKDTINYDRVVSFLKENAGCGYEVVNLHGGEATIHPHFLDVLKQIRDLGYLEVHLQTNAIRLSNPDFAHQVVNLGVRLFIISLHGATPEIQDKQTGTTSGFVRTIQGIRNVIAVGARVRTNTVITNQNLKQLPTISQLVVDLGVHHINLSNIHPVGSAIFGLSRIAPTFAEVRGPLYSAIDIALKNNRQVTLEGFPYCTVREHMGLHLNNEYRNIRMLYREAILDYDTFMNDRMRRFGEPCESCIKRSACGGVYKEYLDLRGWGEFSPIHEFRGSDNESLSMAGHSS